MGFLNFSKKSNVQNDAACVMTWNELAKQLMYLYRNVEVVDKECIVVPVAGFNYYIRYRAKEALLSIEIGWNLDGEHKYSYQDLAVFCNDSNRIFFSKVFASQYDGDDEILLFVVREIPFFETITVAAVNQKLLELVADNGEIMAEFNRRFSSRQDSAVGAADITENKA